MRLQLLSCMRACLCVCVCLRTRALCISQSVELRLTQTLVNEQTQTGQTYVSGVITTLRRMKMWFQIMRSFVYVTSQVTHTHTGAHTHAPAGLRIS